MSHGWLSSRQGLRRVLFLVASAVVVAALCVQVLLVWIWQGEHECRAADGLWDTWRCVKFDACNVDGRRIPLGAVFGDGCSTCECRPSGARCTQGWNPWGHTRCNAASLSSIFDPGCENPRSYTGGGNVFAERPYCGCDGITFVAPSPAKPYRHPGPCP